MKTPMSLNRDPHVIFQAERHDSESCLDSLSIILKDDLVIRSTDELLSTRSAKGLGIGFLNRSLLEGTSPFLIKLLAECSDFSFGNRIDIFYPTEEIRLALSKRVGTRLHDIYEIQPENLQKLNQTAKNFKIENNCHPEDYTDKILALPDRTSITHQIFTTMSQRKETQLFIVHENDQRIAAASYTLVKGNILKLSGVQVDEEYRNRGLQKYLISHRIQHARERFEFDRIYSVAKRDSVSAKNLEKMGFVRTALFEYGAENGKARLASPSI